MKKASSLQKQRENKQILMTELESLEDKLRMLSNKADTVQKKTVTKRENMQNLTSIMDRWRDINTKPPQPENQEPSAPPIQEPPQEMPQEPMVNPFGNVNTVMKESCEELEKTVLKQIKMCIQLILNNISVPDPFLMTLITGTNESIDDFEHLFNQLKLMVFMDKMNQGTKRNDLLAFVFSTM